MFFFWARFKFQWLQLVLRCRLAGMLSSWLQRPILLDVPNAGSEALVRLSTALIHIAPPWNGDLRESVTVVMSQWKRHCHSQHYGTITYYYVPSYVITILYHYSIIQIIHTLDHCSLEFYRTSGFHISWSRHLSCRRRGSRDMRLVSTTVGFFQWLGNELWKSCSEAVSKHVLTDCPSKNICTSYVLQLTSSVPQSPTLRRLRPPLAWRLFRANLTTRCETHKGEIQSHWLNDHTPNCNQDHQDQGSADQPGKSRNFQGRIGIPKFWNAPTQKADLGRQWCIIHRSSRSAPRTSQWVALKVKLASRFFLLGCTWNIYLQLKSQIISKCLGNRT